MADNILKLRVESSEYDQKLKKAAEGIRHLAEVAHKGGGELTGLEKAELDYVKALGSMETKSRTAAGSVRELESTYKELKVIYEQLNEVEKADEGGKALAASLEQIKQRAQEARAQLDNASKSLNDNGQSAEQSVGILESLASKFTLNIDALKLFDMGLSATKAALDVAMDAFFASEANVDEWGRIVASSQSLYEGFLTAINNGDISGYLSNIDSIVEAARKAYDELDKLGTMKTIQAPQISKQQTENERIRQMIQTGRYIAPQDGRTNAVFNGRVMQSGDKLTAGQIRAMEKQLSNGMQSVTKLVGNEVKQTGKAIDAYYNKIAKTNGMTLQEFKKGTSSWDEFSKKMAGYDEYKKWDTQSRIEFAKQGGRGFVDFDKNNPYAEFRKWGTFRVDKDGENSYKDLVSLIQQRDQQVSQMYSTQTQAFRTMNRAEGFTVSKLMGKGGGSGSGTKNEPPALEGSIDAQTKKVQELQKAWRAAADDDSRQKIKAQLDEAQRTLKTMTGVKLPKDTVVDITVDANTAEALQKIGNIEGVTIAPKTVEITATDEALPLLRDIEGITITPKTFSITATEEAMPKLREIQGVTIDPKTLAITATDEALPLLNEIDGVTIDPKTFTINATDEALPLLNEIDGVTFDPKNVTVTADTTEALQRIQKLVAETNGTIIETKVVPVNIKRSLREQGVTTNAMSAWAGAQKKSLGDTEVGSNEYTDISANIVDTETLSNLLQKATEAGLTNVAENINAEGLWESILNGENIPDEVWESIVEEMNDALSELGVDPIKLDVDTGKVIKDVKKVEKEVKGISTAASTVSSVVGSIGQAFNSIEDPAAKVAGTVAQAIATLAAGYATATTQASSMGPWAWIAFAATGLATLISTVSSIHNITGYAQGGIVQGNTFSGDQVGPVMLDAGEVVLNRSQVGNLAAQLEDSRIGGDGGSQPYVSGEMIYLGMNNYLKRSGRGEIITSRK